MGYTKMNRHNYPDIEGLTEAERAKLDHIDDIEDDLADAYDSTATYAVGDWCIRNGKLYECITAIATAEPFDSTKWRRVAVAELKSNLTWKEASTFNQAYTNAINEVLVIISNNNPALGTTFTFPKSFLSSLTNNKYFTNGYHYNASTYALMQIFINISDMSGTCSAYSNGVAVQGAEAKFYYR